MRPLAPLPMDLGLLVWIAEDPPRLAGYDMGRACLECHVCGDHPIQADDDGLFCEAEGWVPCPECGSRVAVSIDDAETPATASLVTDEHVFDLGQPVCDGTGKGCYNPDDALEFAGEGCNWDCSRCDRRQLLLRLLKWEEER